MLKAFKLDRFKSCDHAALPPGALTVLIGAHAAGKRNVIEGLRLLSWLAQGQKLSAIRYAVNTADRVVRGRVEDLCRQGATSFRLGCPLDDQRWSTLDIALECRDGELHIVAEVITGPAGKVPLYQLDQPSKGVGTDAQTAYNAFARGRVKPHITVGDQMAVFAPLDSPATFQSAHQHSRSGIAAVVKIYQRLLSDILFLDPVPACMRDYSFTTDRQLQGDGANLSAVLRALWGGEAPEPSPDVAARRRDILSFIRSLPEQDIDGLGFLTGPRGEVMVQLVETFGGAPRPCDAPLRSDGTLRVLAIVAAMFSATEGSLVVIEEIDHGVHPSRARHLLEHIDRPARRRRLRVLLSTHNPALLDALPPEALPDVVFCYRDPKGGGSRLVKVADIPDVPELLVQGSLGQLMTSGGLERFVKRHPGPAARRAQQRLQGARHGAR